MVALRKPNFDGIPELNRAQLINDLYNFVRYRPDHTLVEFVEFAAFLEQDDSYFSWFRAFTAFDYIIPRIGEEKVRNAFNVSSTNSTKN